MALNRAESPEISNQFIQSEEDISDPAINLFIPALCGIERIFFASTSIF